MNQDIESSRDHLDPSDPVLRLTEQIRAGQVAQDVWDDGVSRFLGINRTDARCLDIISVHGRITAGLLAQEAGLTTGAVTTAVDRLQAAGYALRSRDEADRRKVWIALTSLAGQLNHRIFAHYQLLDPLLRHGLTPEQLAAIAAFLQVSARINTRQAKLLETNLPPAGASAEARLAAAQAFQEAANRLMGDIVGDVANTPPQALRAMIETMMSGKPIPPRA
jgi:DNA-binding MarR family transcriptional regulator